MRTTHSTRRPKAFTFTISSLPEIRLALIQYQPQAPEHIRPIVGKLKDTFSSLANFKVVPDPHHLRSGEITISIELGITAQLVLQDALGAVEIKTFAI